MKGYLTVFIFLLCTSIYATDTIFFATGYDSIIVDVGDKIDYNCNIADNGKLFVCPDAIDNYHFLHFKIGHQEIAGATYYIKFPDTNESYMWEYTYEMTGKYDFEKERNSVTYTSTIEVFWVACPIVTPVISGSDTVINTSVETYTVDTTEGASRYEWYVTPNEAGSIVDNDEQVDFTPNKSYTGEASIYAIAVLGTDVNGDDTLSVKKIQIQNPPMNIKNNSLDSKIKVFPNPAKDILKIECPARIMEYSIYSINGKLLNRNKIHNNTISISNLSSGLYILNITSVNREIYNTSFYKE